MKPRNHPILTALLAILAGALHLYGQGTALTYQGRLLDNGQPGNGSYDLTFTAFNASTGGPANGALTNTGVAVSGGLFTTVLDFGGVPDGHPFWFQLGVRTNGGGTFTTVSPRQAATPTLYALFANTASNLVGSLPVAQLSGTVPLAQLPAEVVVSSGPSGVNLTGTFAGNGGGLTNVAAANLVGTIADARLSANIPRLNVPNTATAATAVPIITSGFITSATVTSGGSGYLTPPLVTVNAAVGGGAVLTAVIAGGSVTSLAVTNVGSGYIGSVTLTIAPPPSNASQTFITANVFSGVNTMTNANNTLAGSFAGNGAGLTNLPPASINGVLVPAQIPSLDASKITGGTMDPALIPVLDAATKLTGTLLAARLPANVVLRDGSNDFTAPNQFRGVVWATNGGNQFAGNLSGNISGNGAGLTNLPASAAAAAPPGMVLIPAGAFTMGDTLDGLSDAAPTNATVAAFYLDVNLVSWSQWQSVYFWATNHGYAFANPGAGQEANHPVQTVDWYDCVKWGNARSQQAGKPPVYYTDAAWTQVYTNGEPTTLYANWTASGYRLPTEAEWEKAARGGLIGQRFPWGNSITANLANYYGDPTYSYDLGPGGYHAAFTNGVTPYTGPTGYFAANSYGLYDMAGNVHEWCWDWYGTPYAGGVAPRGPAGPLTFRVLRGGAWNYDASYARCAYRYYFAPSFALDSFGFRCVRGL